MKLEKFITLWNELDNDDLRCRLLYKHRNSEKLPKYKINVNNDRIFLSFEEDEDVVLDFDEFGYNLIPVIFQSIHLNAELV